MTGLAAQTFMPSKAGGVAAVPGTGVHVDAAGGIDAAGGVEAVAQAGVEVVRAVGGRGVDRAGACVGGDVSGQYAQNAAVEERMLEGGALQYAALEAGQFRGCAQFAGGGDGGGQLGRDDVDRALRAFSCSQRHILKIRMEGHGHRRGQCPGSGGPDDRRNLLARQRRINRRRRPR